MSGRRDMRHSRRGQLQTLEPIIITIVLGIIIVLGVVYYLRIHEQDNDQVRDSLREQDDLALLSTLSRMPELSCSKDISGTNCIDKYKAAAFAKRMAEAKNRLYYFPAFGATNINIEYLDLATGKTTTVKLYAGLQNENRLATRTYFAIHDPVAAANEYGQITQSTNFATMIIEREAP